LAAIGEDDIGRSECDIRARMVDAAAVDDRMGLRPEALEGELAAARQIERRRLHIGLGAQRLQRADGVLAVVEHHGGHAVAADDLTDRKQLALERVVPEGDVAAGEGDKRKDEDDAAGEQAEGEQLMADRQVLEESHQPGDPFGSRSAMTSARRSS
jgi:hypothetical protein